MGPTLLTAADIDAWAARKDAQANLPRLVRRLVRASAENIHRLTFATDEGVQLGGWDGIVVAQTASEFVPDGLSAWELSTNHDPKGKADADYEKRSLDPEGLTPDDTVYVCVTARRWANKDKWARERTKERIWREVRAYDAEDIASWLEAAPAVHIWISRLAGKHLDGVHDFTSTWEEWRHTTSPAILPELVIGGRDDHIQQIHSWLRGEPASFVLQADSPDEAVAFFLAALEKLPDDERDGIISRGAIVQDQRIWTSLIASPQQMVLIPTFKDKSRIVLALQRGHRLFVPLGREDSDLSGIIELPRLSRAAAESALETMGFGSDRARELATLARRSLMSLRRKLSPIAAIQNPQWATPSNARTILAAMLAGTWNASVDGDREIVAQLSEMPYEAYIHELVRWANESDPPAREIGDVWLLASKEDAWRLIARYVTTHDIQRFEQAALLVLGTHDPALDVESERRYMAGVLGYQARYSGLLSRGIADTLAIMGARGESLRAGEAYSASDWAARIVRRLLERANTDWRLWASLESVLPLLAEAAPEVFLNAVAEGLTGDEPVIMKLFEEGGDQLFGPRTYHSGLLWALEVVAWSPDHLGQAAAALAKLARLDPGGRLSNRPANSLSNIFILVRPQTAADLDQRERVLDGIVRREPDIGWTLLCKLIPESRIIAFPTSKPKWREWVPEVEDSVTWAEVWKATAAVTNRLVSLAGTDGNRWAALISRLDQLPREALDPVVGYLLTTNVEDYLPADRHPIWTALRKVISKHSRFSEADWALPASYISKLVRIYKRFEPRDVIDKYEWLFADHPSVFRAREDDWERHFRRLSDMRRRALVVVYRKLGFGGIHRLLARVARPHELGITLGRNAILSTDEEDALLSETLGSIEHRYQNFVQSFVYWRFSEGKGWEWATEKLKTSELAPKQTAHFFACLPPSREVWNRVEELGRDIEALYWEQVGTFFFIDDEEDAIRVTQTLLRFDRAVRALDFISMFSQKKATGIPPALIADALEQAARSKSISETDLQSFGPYHVEELLDQIEMSEEISAERIAQLEWMYLPVFRHHAQRRPKVLHRELAKNPDFFAEIVSYAYKAEDGREEESPSEDSFARAELAYQLLDSWRSVPGEREDGTLDNVVLRDWVMKAREAVRGRGRRVGDLLIGNLLRYSPVGEDGAWPSEPVRDLIEELESESLERGIQTEVMNSRGVTTRGPTDGGMQERVLSEKYTVYARTVADGWPRTAAMLRRIAGVYEREARREDTEAELTEDLW